MIVLAVVRAAAFGVSVALAAAVASFAIAQPADMDFVARGRRPRRTPYSHARRRRCRMPIDKELLEILACPVDKSPVREEGDRLVCTQCGRRYPVRDEIPVMLVEEAELPGSAGG